MQKSIARTRERGGSLDIWAYGKRSLIHLAANSKHQTQGTTDRTDNTVSLETKQTGPRGIMKSPRTRVQRVARYPGGVITVLEGKRPDRPHRVASQKIGESAYNNY